MDAPEVVVGLLPHHRVREDEHGAHDGEERDASQAGQRLQDDKSIISWSQLVSTCHKIWSKIV